MQRIVGLIDGRVRVGFVVFGGMVALQSSQELDLSKFVYLAGAAAALLGSIRSVVLRRDAEDVRSARLWLVASATIVGLVAISFVVARANGTATTPWLRDSATYLLFATIPIFALDLGASGTTRTIVAMLTAAGLLGGFSWAVEWLARRDIVELPVSRLLFPSPQLPGMLYLFAFATAIMLRRAGWAWALLAGIVFGLFLVTGTRSSLLLLVGPLTMAAMAGRRYLGSSGRWFVVQGVTAAAVVLTFQLTLSLMIVSPTGGDTTTPGGTGGPGVPGSSSPRPDIIGDRFRTLGGLFNGSSSDGSISERGAQYAATWQLFNGSPLVGRGPGLAIDWIDVSGFARTGFTADTPLVYPAKFGLIGLLALLPLLAAYVGTIGRLVRQEGRRSVVVLTLVGYAAASVVSLPLGFPMEDKGTSLALILILALAFREIGRRPAAQDARRE